MEMSRENLEDKEKEVKDAKDQLRQAKEVAIHEYCDFDALLEELGTLMRTALMMLSVRLRKLILILTFLNSILIRKPKVLLNPSIGLWAGGR